MIRKVVDVKNPVLRQVAKPVLKFDKKTKELIVDMKETLAHQKDPEGVGLAAPQIGRSLQIFLINTKGKERVCINPKILTIKEEKIPKSKKKKKTKLLEGCLSLPHYYGPLKRATIVELEYQDENGKKQVETFTDFLGQIVLHEMDHLNGILFVDRIIEQKAPLYKFDGNEWEEVELV